MKGPKAVKTASGMWRCQVYADGRRHSITAPTRREAERQAAGIKTGYLSVSTSAGKVSLTAAIDGYLDAKSSVLSASTVRGYRTIQRCRYQRLMQMDINKLTLQIAQIAVNQDCKGRSPKTVCNGWGLIHAVLKFYGITLDGVRLPQQQRTDRQWLQSDEVGVLLRELDGDRCELPILLALWLGMRRSEILGLCWDSVDLERGLLVVRRAYVYASAGTWVLQERAKTRGSQRVIHLPDYIVERFRRLDPGEPEERVFSGFDPGLIRKRLQRACQRAGITVTHLHGLRHTFAAVMLREGVDERIVMRQGGWTSSRTLREIYDYIMDDDNNSALKVRDEFFTGQ